MESTRELSASALTTLQAHVQPEIDRLGNHPLFARMKSIDDFRCFMCHHVYAVWDFMCLLKALQEVVTCTRSPWVPTGDARVRRLINEICLDEESDELADGRCFSHFELYLEAMNEAGASTRAATSFVDALRSGKSVIDALHDADAPEAAREFVRHTMDVIESGSPHRIAAAFTIGREEAIPGMFPAIVDAVVREQPALTTFHTYLQRHIELDGDKHGPLGMQMLAQLCGDDATRWREAEASALAALDARSRLWDGVAEAL